VRLKVKSNAFIAIRCAMIVYHMKRRAVGRTVTSPDADISLFLNRRLTVV
jgi:hypothetical protein